MRKKPAKRACTECGRTIKKTTESVRPGLCIICYGQAIKEERECQAKAAAADTAAKPIRVYPDAYDDFFPEVDGLGGFSWPDSNFCPLG